jgi:hypothetical protein
MCRFMPPNIEDECMEPVVLVRGWTSPVDSVRMWIVDKLKSEGVLPPSEWIKRKTTPVAYHAKTRRSCESSAQLASSRFVPTSKYHCFPGMPRDSDGNRSRTSSPLGPLLFRKTTRFPDAIMGYGDIPFE